MWNILIDVNIYWIIIITASLLGYKFRNEIKDTFKKKVGF